MNNEDYLIYVIVQVSNSWFSNYLDTSEVFQLISNRHIVNSRKHARFDCHKITTIFTINNNYVHNSGAPYRMKFQ